MISLGIYVTSRYKNYPEFKTTMDEAIKKYISVGKPNALVTGSSKSNSSGNGLVKRYAFESGIPCRIFETQWEKSIPTKPGKKNTAGVKSNAMIVRNSTGCIMFWTPTSIAKWDFMSGGCYNFRKMCGKMGRELIPIKVDIYKSFEDVEITPTRANEEPTEHSLQSVQNDQMLRGINAQASDLHDSPQSIPTGVGASSASHIPTPHPSADVDSDVNQNFEHVNDVPVVHDQSEVPQSNTSSEIPSPQLDRLPSGSISDIPVDITGDGLPDTTITVADTNMDGIPDSKIVTVDTNGNGAPDDISLEPLPQPIQSQQTIQQQQPSQPIPDDENNEETV